MLKPQLIPPVPEITARAAHAAFPNGNRYLTLRDNLGTIFSDDMFADLFPKVGQPAAAPWRLAFVLIVQHAEGLSDREVADAVRDRITLRYLLGLEYDDPGFDFSILSRFRHRLTKANAENRLLDAIIERCKQQGLLKGRGKARTDSTRILASVRRINRLELIGETLRTTLNKLAVVAPEWLQEQVNPDWYPRYAKRFEKEKIPRGAEKETALAEQIERDGIQLVSALYHPASPRHLSGLPEVEMLRRSPSLESFLERLGREARKADFCTRKRSPFVLLSSPYAKASYQEAGVVRHPLSSSDRLFVSLDTGSGTRS